MRFPRELALEIATEVCTNYSEEADMDITIFLYKPDEEEQRRALRRELEIYLMENDYSQLDERDYKEKEAMWSQLPAHREERQILDLMRKQYECKIKDQKEFKKYVERLKRAARKTDNSFNSMNTVSFQHMMTLNSFMKEEKAFSTFDEVLTEIMEKNGIKSYAQISRSGRIYEGTLSRIRSEDTRVQRDYLWSIAIGARCDIKETEKLFNACSHSLYGSYRMTDKDIRRETAIRYFIEYNKYDIDKINYQLEDLGFDPLGNMTKNVF